MAEAPLLVVLRALKLGDFLTGLPALRALAAHFPDHRRVLAAPAGLRPLVDHVAVVHELVPTPGLVPLTASLRPPAVAVDLHGRGPLSQPLLVALHPARLIAFEHPDIPATRGGPVWRRGEHEVQRWCRLLAESGIPADPGDLDIPEVPPSPFPEAAGATIVHPGAADPARRWPADRFAAVARAEAAAGRRVLLTGTVEEAALARQVARLADLPAEAVVASRTTLLDLVGLIARAGRVITGDTGVAHVATATRTPSVVLFGPVPPSEWGPPADRPNHLALWAGRAGDPHGTQTDPGLLRIHVDTVLAALERLPPPVTRPLAAKGS
jgi:ADP-heptose:LPS heptosyltransferase